MLPPFNSISPTHDRRESREQRRDDAGNWIKKITRPIFFFWLMSLSEHSQFPQKSASKRKIKNCDTLTQLVADTHFPDYAIAPSPPNVCHAETSFYLFRMTMEKSCHAVLTLVLIGVGTVGEGVGEGLEPPQSKCGKRQEYSTVQLPPPPRVPVENPLRHAIFKLVQLQFLHDGLLRVIVVFLRAFKSENTYFLPRSSLGPNSNCIRGPHASFHFLGKGDIFGRSLGNISQENLEKGVFVF